MDWEGGNNKKEGKGRGNKMIPLEKQVTSLEPSMRLKELWVKQDGLYSYFQYDKWNVLLRETKEIFAPNNECGCNKDNLICSAFTVAEHGIALPRNIHSYRDTDFKTEFWVCEQRFKNREFADTEANARAKMRIYLIEHKLVEVNRNEKNENAKRER